MTRRLSMNGGRKSRKTAKGVAEFYSGQNDQIESLLKPIDLHASELHEQEEQFSFRVKIAVRASFIANLCLLVLQIYAAASSLSLSFFATAIDAIFDPCANLVLNWAHRKASRVDLRKYPSGGSRFESIGNIVYSGVMGMVSLILIVESIQSIATHKSTDDDKFHLPAVIAVGVAFLTKLGLFIFCHPLRDKSSQVRVLWEDHRNDLMINGFGIFTSSAGAKIIWWLDPLGAILISLLLIGLWGHTCYEHFSDLAGKSAPTEFLQLVIYKAMTFSDQIEKIDSCKAYHSGPNYVVEVDVVMDAQTPLWKAHDLAQDLQDKLETLPRVDRAFVHIDHETDHRPEHRKYA